MIDAQKYGSVNEMVDDERKKKTKNEEKLCTHNICHSDNDNRISRFNNYDTN